MLSIVIPTLNATASLDGALKAIANVSLTTELIVADAGSADDTCDIARKFGANVIVSPRGRGTQLAAAAKAAKGDWLLFVHADTVLADGWDAAVAEFTSNSDNLYRAAVFRLMIDDTSLAARRLERIVAWRTRVVGLPYGDQGLLISRLFYNDIGGFKDMVLMEDVDIIRRISRQRITMFDIAAITSARRYIQDGYVRRSSRNILCLGLYFIGVSPQRIARIYR